MHVDRKSTLLDLLAGRKTIGQMSGEILFAGASPTKPFLRRFTGLLRVFLAHLSPSPCVPDFLCYAFFLAHLSPTPCVPDFLCSAIVFAPLHTSRRRPCGLNRLCALNKRWLNRRLCALNKRWVRRRPLCPENINGWGRMQAMWSRTTRCWQSCRRGRCCCTLPAWLCLAR